MDVNEIREMGKAILDQYKRETAVKAAITFKRAIGTRSERPGWTVLLSGEWAGYVYKGSDDLWRATVEGFSVSDGTGMMLTWRTRREASEAVALLSSVERLARVHWRNATSNNPKISSGDSPVYLASRKALLGAIAAVYEDMDAMDVYYAWTDHGETVWQTVAAMRREAIDAARYAAEMAAEEARWEAEQAEEAKRQETLAVFTEMPDTAERMMAAVVSPDADGTLGVTLGIVTPDMDRSKATGFTTAGTPFNVSHLKFTDAGAAWRMLDVLVAELRTAVNPYRIAILGDRPDKLYVGTVYGRPVVAPVKLPRVTVTASGRAKAPTLAQALAESRS